MSEKEIPSVDDFVINIEMTVKEANALLNVLNQPNQVPTTTYVAFINLIQRQAGPQAQKAKDSLEAVAKAQNEPKTTS